MDYQYTVPKPDAIKTAAGILPRNSTVRRILVLLLHTPNLTSREIESALRIRRADTHMWYANTRGTLSTTTFRFAYTRIDGHTYRWFVAKTGEGVQC